MRMVLPMGMITIIRLENLVGAVSDWPRRETDRSSLNEINADRGGDEIFLLHGREVRGSGRQVESLRGKTIDGWVVVSMLRWLQADWLCELVRVIEPEVQAASQAPRIKLQYKWWCSTMDATGELSPADLIKVCHALEGKRLNIRGFHINEYDGEQVVSLVLGPDLDHGAPAPVQFDYQDDCLFVSFDE